MKKLTPLSVLEELIPQKQISESRLVEDMDFYSSLQKRIDACAEASQSSPPRKHFDITNTLEKYSLMKKLLWMCEEQTIIKERALNDMDVKDVEAIQSIKTSREMIFKKMEMINYNSSIYMKRRDFMPLFSSNFKEHTSNAFFSEFSLWFLGDDFMVLNPHREQYKKIINTEHEFNFLKKLFFTASTPDDFVSLVAKLTNVDPIKVALCRFEAKYTGFVIAHKKDAALSAKLNTYSQAFPNSLPKLESEFHDNLWILNLMENSILETDIVNNFDIWIDLSTLVIYAKTSLFPLSLNLDIPFRVDHNIDYAYFTFFDYNKNLNVIEKSELKEILLRENPFQNPHEFFVFNGNEFIHIENFEIKSHCNLLLIKYTITEYVSRLIIFDFLNREILDNIDFESLEKGAYINLYNDTLSLLELDVMVV